MWLSLRKLTNFIRPSSRKFWVIIVLQKLNLCVNINWSQNIRLLQPNYVNFTLYWINAIFISELLLAQEFKISRSGKSIYSNEDVNPGLQHIRWSFLRQLVTAERHVSTVVDVLLKCSRKFSLWSCDASVNVATKNHILKEKTSFYVKQNMFIHCCFNRFAWYMLSTQGIPY